MAIPGGSETILLVEDEASVQTVIGRLLGKLGYTVLFADNGQECISVFDDYVDRIDLIITDIVMPGQTGIEMARELRERKPDLKILFMSGYAGPEAGVLNDPPPEPFLSKPFSVEELAEAVRTALDA